MTGRPTIPIVAYHRGVGLHADQDKERLEVVRADIDAVFLIADDVKALVRFCGRRDRAPEARLFARAILFGMVEQAREKRLSLPEFDPDYINALTGPLDSLKHRSIHSYDTYLAPRCAPGSSNRPVKRAIPLPDPWAEQNARLRIFRGEE